LSEDITTAVADFDWSTVPQILQDKGVDLGIEFGVKVATALAIFLIGKFIIRLLVNAITKVMKAQAVDETLTTFVSNLARVSLLIVVIIAAVSALGVETTSFIAIFGAAGLAIGLAMQGSLSNFASGVLIVLFRPYRVGDYIEAAGISGTVEQVQILTTILKTPDNKRIIVPNSQIMDGIITNYSANSTRRIDMVVGVSYSDDLDKVRTTIEALLAAEDRILDEPAATIAVSQLGDSSVNFVVRPWVNTSDYWPVTFDLNEAIKKRFDREGISIPFPQRDVHLYNHSDD
jgi:small conductance mechanosensitive channel